MKKIFLLLVLGVFLIPNVIDGIYAEQASIRFELTYPNGDRMSLGNSQLQINSEDKEINLELIGKKLDPYFNSELPIGKKYKISAYSNDMLVGTKFLALENKISQVIKIPINPSIGMKFFAYYEDGATPIEDAVLKVYSHKGNVIQTTHTDAEGKTQRFWLPSTISEGEFYKAEVSIDNDIVYEYSPIRLASGSHDFKIVTDWPAKVDYIIIQTSTENSPNYSWGANYIVEIFDSKGFEKTVTFNRGSAHISELKVGKYGILIYDENDPSQILANSEISIDKGHAEFKIETDKPYISRKNLEVPQNNTIFNSIQTTFQDIENLANLTWVKQSAAGIQKLKPDSDFFLELETGGEGNAVFTRSKSFSPINLANKELQLSYKIDKPLSLKEFWVYFSNDNFESSWQTFKIPIDDIPPNKKTIQIFELNDMDITGEINSTKITQIQFRIKDKSNESVNLEISDFKIMDLQDSFLKKGNDPNISIFDSCECIAFRLDDVQDHFLDDVQMEIINSFIESDVKLTIGVIGGQIGDDQKLVSFLKYNKNSPYLKFANHGWEHENFTQFSKEGQEMLILRANDKIKSLFGVQPDVFIPPFNAFNDDTISALESLKFTHFSSELDEETPPFPKYGQKLYRFPETAFTGDLNKEQMKFVGVSHQTTLQQINESMKKFGFAVVTLHPQEFANFYDDNYKNEINSQQFNELKWLFSSLKDKKIKIVFLDEIDVESSLVPTWIKHNAKWWAEEKINDITFVNGIQFLIDEKIIHVNPTEKNGPVPTKIPPWMKSNAKWWSEDLLSDEEFVKGVEYLIDQNIINI